MNDSRFSSSFLAATLTFTVLAAGTAAIGSEFWREARGTQQVIQLERVVITGKRVPTESIATGTTTATSARAEAVVPATQRLQ